MTTPANPAATADVAGAFRVLSARLLARRAGSFGLRLWVVVAALALSIGAFTYWQVRVPLDGAVHHHGALGGTRFLAWRLAASLLGAGIIAGRRQTTLATMPPGPEWLTLPVPAVEIEKHLAREARLPAVIVFVPAFAAWLAGFGLLGVGTLAWLAAGFPVGWQLVTRAACALALRAVARPVRGVHSLPAVTRALIRVRQRTHVRALRPARFVAEPAWRALARLDRRVSLRAGSPRARLVLALVFLVLSVAVWSARDQDPLETRAQAFAAFAIACSGLGAWAAWRAAGDPPAAVRPLPIGLGDAWKARALPMFAAIGAVLVLQAACAVPLPVAGRVGLILAWLVPGVLVPLIGLHMGLSLSGSPAAAEHLYYGWLVAGIVASLAIPLLGWGVLIGAFVHATRRIGRWNLPEIA